MPEPPYGEIVDLLKAGQVIPFLGAGVNFGTRPPEAKWDERDSDFLPSGSELSHWLADKIRFPSINDHDRNDLAKVASYFVETSARQRLRRRLEEVFGRACRPASIHEYLARIARYRTGGQEFGTPLLVVTTNYDDLLEQAFSAQDPPRPFHLVVYPTDRDDIKGSLLWWRHGATEPEVVPTNSLFIELEQTNVIYKMHGSVHRQQPDLGSYVITEEDYVDFLSGMTTQKAVPPLFMRHFHSRHFLFLGYGLQDWNLRVVLKNIKNPRPEDIMGASGEAVNPPNRLSNDLRSWAIQYRPSELEVALWDARQVKIYDVDINEFVKGLDEEEG